MQMKLLETSSAAKSRIYKEFNMTARGVTQDVVALKEWLIKQPHLPYIRGENVDHWLENYIIANKNSLERAKESLDMYFSVRVLVPEVFTMRDPLHAEIRKSAEVMGLGVLPKLTPEGRRIIVFQHFKETSDDFEPNFMLKRLSMVMDILLQEGVDYIGIEIIVDTKFVCTGHLARYNLSILKRSVEMGWKAYPQRVYKIHVVNPWAMVETGIALFKPLLGKKMQDRFVVHRNVRDIHRYIPKEVLPEDFEGEGPSFRVINDMWQEKLVQYRDWFLSNENIKSDETKRAGKCRYEAVVEHTFGNQGSFRKIEVD